MYNSIKLNKVSQTRQTYDFYLVVKSITFKQHLRLLLIALNGALLVTKDKSIGSDNLRPNYIFDIATSMRTTRLDL